MDSPYKTTFTTSSPKLNMDVGTQIDRYKEEEAKQKAPLIQPFTLDNSMELLSDIYEKLLDMRKAVEKTAMQPKANKQALAAINSIIENIGKEILMDIPEQLDKLNL